MIIAVGFWTIIFGYITAFTATAFIVCVVISFYYDRKADYKLRKELYMDETFARKNRIGK